MSVFYSWRDIVSLERYCYNDFGFDCTKTPSEKAEKSQVENLSVYIHLSPNQKRSFFAWLFKHMDLLLMNHTKWWIIIVKHPSYNIVIFICDLIFSVLVIWEIFISYFFPFSHWVTVNLSLLYIHQKIFKKLIEIFK